MANPVISRRQFLWQSALGLSGALAVPSVLKAAGAAAPPAGRRPNIIVILADDLGYGDVGCYGATSIKTPNLDRLASQGLRFTDGHSTSSVCTPSRYSLLTGQYAWRKPGTGIASSETPLLIEPGSPTLPQLMKNAGYATACIGKWHLGLGTGALDWNGKIAPGPLEVGFDSCFIMPATGDRVPCVFIEDHHVAGLDPQDPLFVGDQKAGVKEPTGQDNPELLKIRPSRSHNGTIVNGISRLGSMSGGQSARWKDEDIADTITGRAVSFIEKNQAKPFFLYFCTHDPHVPRVPHERFRGASGCGVRGDVIVELDACVGRIMDALDRLELADDTLVVFSSDNGPVVDDGYADGAKDALNGHDPAGRYRGGKYQLAEGGTRVPFVVRWPGKVSPGESAALVSQVDLLASLATVSGYEVPRAAAADSQDLLPALLGRRKEGRESLIVQAQFASALAVRNGRWKLISPAADAPGGQAELYDLASDPGERTNLAGRRPEKVKELMALLRQAKGA
jgi:arylsulfatase A-like enzyme